MENNSQKKCPHCQTDIPLKASKCPQCQSDLRNWSARHKILTALLIIILVPIVIGFVFSSLNPSPGSSGNNSQAISSDLKIGDTGYLKSSSGTVMMGTTKTNYDEVMKLSVAKDTDGVTQMVLNGQALLVDSGTQIRVIDVGMFIKQVRILGGKYYGQSGWLPDEFVSKEK